ncbi:MAG: class B sortase [Ruminococcus sp.]|nr:class B sortase [Ruminococcus sp.]
MKKKTIRILAVAVAAALLFGGVYLLTKDDIAQKKAEGDLAPFMPSVIMQDALAYAPAESVTTTTGTSTSETTSEEGTTSSIISETVPSVQENVLSPKICEELKEQAQELQESYPDAIGWIYVSDTNINYPIMQGKDNDFYLTHGTDGRSLKCGCIELDFRCENRFQNNFNILYGHNMKNGSMFANVCRFKDKSYYDSHPYGWVYTADSVFRLDFFSVAVTDWHDEIYNGFRSLDEWTPHLKEISRIYEEVELTDQDRLVLLSTCSYEFDNARTVLTGRLVEMESDMNA